MSVRVRYMIRFVAYRPLWVGLVAAGGAVALQASGLGPAALVAGGPVLTALAALGLAVLAAEAAARVPDPAEAAEELDVQAAAVVRHVGYLAADLEAGADPERMRAALDGAGVLDSLAGLMGALASHPQERNDF